MGEIARQLSIACHAGCGRPQRARRAVPLHEPARGGEESFIPARLDNRDIILIAGEDPYAYKGLEEMHRPHIRADGKGGCASDRNDEFRGE